MDNRVTGPYCSPSQEQSLCRLIGSRGFGLGTGSLVEGDGKVDIEDLKVFMTYWEKENPPKSKDAQ